MEKSAEKTVGENAEIKGKKEIKAKDTPFAET